MDILQMNIYGSIIIILTVIVRAIAINKLPKRTFIILWLIAIVRLTVPFTLPPLLNVYPVVDKINEITGDRLVAPDGNRLLNTAPIENKSDNHTVSDENNSPVMSEKADYAVYIYILIWSIGLTLFAVLFVIPHLRNSGKYKSALPSENEYISEWQKTHTLRRKYKILVSDEINSAFTFGLFRPVIVLPDNAELADNRTLDYVLTHEYIHIKRFDITLKWISAVCMCLNWFNPFVWVMYILMNRDIELSCDEGVLRSKGEDNKKTYALMLVDMEAGRVSYNPLVNSFNKYAVRERVTSIMKNRKLGVISIVLAFVLVVCSSAVLVSSCTKGEDKDTTIDADIQQTQSPETTQATTEEDPYANVRFGETRDILLLDIEWHTYDTYLKYIEDNVANIREFMKDKYDETEIEKQVDEYRKNQDVNVKYIKDEGIYIPRTINGMPADQTGYYFLASNPYNNFIDIDDQSIKKPNPNGFYEYYLYPTYVNAYYNSLKTGEYVFKRFYEDGYYYVSSEKEYEYVLESEIIPYCDQMLADGVMSQDDYDRIVNYNPRDAFIRAFFPEAVK